MNKQYPQRIQSLVNRLIPLALRLDKDGAIPCYAFGSDCDRLPHGSEGNIQDIDIDNYSTYIADAMRSRMPIEMETQGGFLGMGGTKVPKLDNDGNPVRKARSSLSAIFHGLGYSNNEPLLLEKLKEEYQGKDEPVLVIVVHDGGVGQTSEIKRLIMELANSRVPLFFQFVGWGGRDYGILEELDDLKGRLIDNADFFALSQEDLETMKDEVLLDKLLNEFPKWLEDASAKGVIRRDSCRPQLAGS